MGWVLDLADRTWPVTRRLMAGHTFVYKASGGLIGHRFPGLPSMLLLDHVGARSRVMRTSPLLYVTDGENLVIVASKGGYPKNPAWYHNLMANPDTTVQVGREKRSVHARVATDEERPRLWDKAAAAYPGYRDYQARSKGRTIPLVVLERR
jgi:deazaflavin-dependent oxidoreductase (nitroreductase family)